MLGRLLLSYFHVSTAADCAEGTAVHLGSFGPRILPAPSGTIRPGRTGLWPWLLRTWPAHLHSGPLEMGTESDRIGHTARHFPDFELGFNMVYQFLSCSR